MLYAADLFCGAGGTTVGAEATGRVKVKLAINHWKPAIFTHQDNHPDAHHIHARLDHVDPRDFVNDGIDLIFASPECTHHSNARGGRPVDDQKRAGGWDVLKWVEALRPKWLVVENVREWLDWGPVASNGKPLKSKKGETFKAWVSALRSFGYRVEWKLLNAADYGEATSRIRLFVIARKGNRRIPWPEPTHSASANGKPAWRSAVEIIDWSKPCPSIFTRKRPLADKTLRRIEIGIKKFCAAPFQYQLIGRGAGRSNGLDRPVPTMVACRSTHGVVTPFVVKFRGTNHTSPIGSPVPTITAGGQHLGVATPFLVKYHGGKSPQRDGTERSHSLQRPIPTIDTQPRFALASPFIVPNFGERNGQLPRTHSLEQPLPAVTSHGAGQLALPFFLPRVGFYDVDALKRARCITEPLPTLIASHHPGHLVLPFMVNMKGKSSVASLSRPFPTVTAHARHLACAMPYLMDVNHGDDRHTGCRTYSVDRPLGTLTAIRNKAVCTPFIASYYGTDNVHPVSNPLATVTTKHRHSLVQPWISQNIRGRLMLRLFRQVNDYGKAMRSLLHTMWNYGVVDIGFRMLDLDELLQAQGFPRDYKLFGTKTEQTRMIGNAVCPGVAKAICESITQI